jgi:hypothetical protein
MRQASSQEGNDEIGTPEALVNLLHEALDTDLFSLDPASGAQPVRIAEEQFTKDDNGLQTSWAVSGSSVYLNPPYSDPTPWLRRLTHFVDPEDDAKLDFGVVVLKADTSTDYFQQYVTQAEALCFPDRRLTFYEPEEDAEMDDPPWPVLIALFGDPPQAIPEALATGCDGLFDQCAIYTTVKPSEIGGQQTLEEILADGGVSVQEALEESPYWAAKPEGGYAADTDWYLDRTRADAIHSAHAETRSRP